MQANDDIIRKTLRKDLQRIDDDSFTQDIVKTHLERKAFTTPKPFVNFSSLIVGLSLFIGSLGLVLLIRTNGEWINETGVTEHHGVLILTISLLFLVFKWLEEVIVSRHMCRI